MNVKKLGRFEFELVEYIAENPGPVRDIVTGYADVKGITRGAIVKSLDRLVKKGVIQREQRDGLFNYSVDKTSAELQEGAIRSFVDAHLRGRISPIAAFLVKDDRLSADEVEAVQSIIRRLESGERHAG